MKCILKKTLGRAILSYEELVTTLCNCEYIINERTLTTVSCDPILTAVISENFLNEIKYITILYLKINTRTIS